MTTIDELAREYVDKYGHDNDPSYPPERQREDMAYHFLFDLHHNELCESECNYQTELTDTQVQFLRDAFEGYADNG